MSTRQHFSVAPWPTTLKVISGLSTILLVVLGTVAYNKALPFPGFAHTFGLGIAFVFPAILVCSILFMVTGYAVEGNMLHVERLLWSTSISLEGLNKAWQDPTICKGSIRIFGNGGLYSFTGIYHNKALGRFRLFATDLSKATVLVLPQRTIVVTPIAPQIFIDYLHHRFPTLESSKEQGKNDTAT